MGPSDIYDDLTRTDYCSHDQVDSYDYYRKLEEHLEYVATCTTIEWWAMKLELIRVGMLLSWLHGMEKLVVWYAMVEFYIRQPKPKGRLRARLYK